MPVQEFIRGLWVSDEEYNQKWLPIKEMIFSGKRYPKLIFNPDYHLYGLTSTGLLVKEEIEVLQKCLRLSQMEDEFILIVEDELAERPNPQLKLKLPLNQAWYRILPFEKSFEELILQEFQLTTGCYCIFSSNANWAKYTSIDLVDMDMDIWAFKDKKLMELFRSGYMDFPRNINKEFIDILPEAYKGIEL